MNGGRRSRGVPPLAEINVTPFVDVALVLLIIFMITAHVMEYGIEIDVPKTKTVATSTKELPVVQVIEIGRSLSGQRSGQHQPAGGRSSQRSIRARRRSICGPTAQTPFDQVATGDERARRRETGCQRSDATGRKHRQKALKYADRLLSDGHDHAASQWGKPSPAR